MYPLLRSLLFKLDPERAHHLALSSLHFVPQFCFKKPAEKRIDTMGLVFSHPIGLAAGLDKNAEHLDALAKLGFSFIEVGTVTPKPQLGNPKPRLFRIPEAQAIINRMGFNNYGVDALVSNIQKSEYRGILGINIGKNKDTSLDQASEDYLHCFRKTYKYASYITINISSPNTPDLRQLQQGDYFAHLLSQLKIEQVKLADQYHRHVPIVVKISPDETEETLKQMCELIITYGVEGIIATNTTCAREMLGTVSNADQQGGLSGRPLATLSTQCLRLLRSYLGNAITLIGVGGIDSVGVAEEKMQAGANLLQIYTGLIYQGPNLVSQLTEGLCEES